MKQFTEKDLVSFGNYLLSKERQESVSEENQNAVTDADLANWQGVFKEEPTPIDEIFTLIKQERQRQDEKWGEQNHHSIVWCAILGEEVGEVNKAALEANFDNTSLDNYKDELIQVVAVGCAALEALKRAQS